MAQENIISWNVPNWVTVVLMSAIGITLLGFITKWVQSRSS